MSLKNLKDVLVSLHEDAIVSMKGMSSSHLSEGIPIATLRHTEMAEELVTLQATVSSTVEFMLGSLPDKTFQVEVVDELVVEFWKVEERLGERICDLLLRLPFILARLANHVDEATGQRGVELAARWEADPELEALRTSVTRVRDLVLDRVDEPSSLATSLSRAVELLEGWVDAAAANGVYWGTCSTLVATLSHFPKLEVM
jgi:hypothetical protein